MPFTFSHPAIVLPLTLLPRRLASATGLIVGSMAPDFEYFLRMKVQSEYSHTLWGLLLFCLPLGLVIAFLFHEWAKPALVNNFPGFLQVRSRPMAQYPWRKYFAENWLVVCVSVLIGAVSHVLWDGCTHAHGFFVQAWPGLSVECDIAGRSIPVYKLLQHGSSLAGAVAIGWVVMKLPADGLPAQPVNPRYWMMVLGWTGIVVAARCLAGGEFAAYGNLIVSAIAAFLMGLLLVPLVLRWKSKAGMPE
ncbi:DUF4184 family protein [Chitinophaga sp. NPDC101104]|uniref:DUF4184 family protein n=1 Tax=Chitinophaga sp. NPDC101104 TaxID=3390561 RepID=UPI003D06022B